jgi:TRAP transporter 4TM/12TM fusion protein
MGRVLRERGHQFLPLAVIMVVLVNGYSAPYAATLGLLSVIPVALMRKTTRKEITVRLVLEGLIEGIRNSLQVAAACACSGIVIGVIALSGVGIEFTSFVISLADDTLLLALILTAFAGIILGMGLPTTPAYIVQVALLVPAIIKLGVPLEAAHMFVFYFAILSAITPPVAITLYAANGLSGAGLWDGGIAAMKLAATGYIIPFMFVYGPSLLLIGEPITVAVACVTSVVGVVCLAAGLHGYFLRRANVIERLLLVAAALSLIKPGLSTDLIGVALIGSVAFLQLVLFKRAAAEV